MRRWAILTLLLGVAWPAMAAKNLTVAQMEELLARLEGAPDKKVASELDKVQLTERVSRARLERWEAEFSGAHVREKLMKLADLSAFNDPPAADELYDARPDKTTLEQMLARTLNYVRNTISRMPEFYATRDTTHFEDSVSQSMGYQVGSTSVQEHESLSAMTVNQAGVTSTTVLEGLQSTGKTSTTVTYRDGQEVRDEDAGARKKEERPAKGLTTSGEFGPILEAAIGDMLKSGLRWLRWEQGPSGPAAVFQFVVPQNESHFRVGITSRGKADEFFPAYHGELTIDPATGQVLRLSEIADIAPPHEKMRAALMVEYAPVTIGGRSYVCPVRAVAFSKTPVPKVGSVDEATWPEQTSLNDVAFTNYHEFGSEARIVANAGGANGGGESRASGAESGASAGAMAAADKVSATLAASTKPAGGAPAAANAGHDGGGGAATATPAETTKPDLSATKVAEPEAAAATAPVAAVAAATPADVPAGTTAAAPIFHAKSNLVVLDVVVMDHDRPVPGLDRDRFHVFEDGHEEKIASFDENKPAAKVEVATPTALPANTYSNAPVYPETGSVNVLLLDALNTPTSDQERVRRAMIDFMGTIKQGTPMAIFTLSSQLRMAAGFTTNLSQLMTVLKKEKADARGPSSVGSGKGSDLSSDIEHAAESVAISNDPGDAWLVSMILRFAADTKTYDTDQRTRLTLDALGELARYLSAVPGRKNLIWFSGSFPIGLGPEASLMMTSNNLRDYTYGVQRTSALLAAARVAVYPVDARGLMMAPTADATYTPPVFPGTGQETGPTGAMERDNRNFGVETAREKSTMGTIAEDTGGHTYSTGNDLKASIEKIVTTDESYYALSYVPPESNEGKNGAAFHKIEVKLDGGKFQLAYRRGYYTANAMTTAENAGGIPSQISDAAQLGAPPSTQIVFQAQVEPQSESTLKGVALDDAVKGEKTTLFGGGSQRYVVQLSVGPQQLTFAEGSDGRRNAKLQCVLVAYGSDGTVVNSLGRQMELTFSPEEYQRLVSAGSGVPLRLAIDLPPGQIALRVVVYEPETAKTGSMEIPVEVAAAR